VSELSANKLFHSSVNLMRTVLAVACAIMLVLARRNAQAEPPRGWRLDVYAPEVASCVTAESLRAQIQERVGSSGLLDTQEVDHRVIVRTAAHKGHDFSVVISLTDVLRGNLGEREVHIESGSCSELTRSLVLVISTMMSIERDGPAAMAPVDSGARGVPATPSAERARAAKPRDGLIPPPVTPPLRSLAADSRPPKHSRGSLRMGLSLLAEAHTGLLPGLVPLSAWGLFARHDWIEVRLTVSAAPWAVRALGRDARATFQALLGRADLCGVPFAGHTFDLSLCAGAEAGAIRAVSRGLHENATTLRPVAQLALRASVEIALLPKHALLLNLGATLPIVSQTYRVVEEGEARRSIHRVEPGVVAEIGWLICFWS
jgi:hypothetical protein